MPKPKRSYKDLEAEILRLREQQEALKEAKVEIFLREFRKKSFQEKLLDVDDAVLKKVAREYVSAFDTDIFCLTYAQCLCILYTDFTQTFSQ